MERKFRIHVLGVPHTITNEDFLACAFTQKALKFCKMMKGRGHTVFHYGHEDSNTMADEDVTVITNKVWEEVYGTHDYRNKLFKYDTGDKAYQEFFKNAIAEIEKRKQPNDIVLPFWGSGVRPICNAHEDIHIIEPGIGYSGGHWAPFKVFESYAILHAYQGLANVGECRQGNYDIVIPNYFDLDNFEYEENKDDYFLYLGRVYEGKGIHIAMQITDAAGVKLKVAGQPDETYTDYDWPDHVEFVGYAGVEERKELMKNAKGSLLPSQYLEPFGGVQIENLLAGTPTITADWGAFAENNIEGVTGYRCRTFEDYVRAIKNVQAGKIKSIDCRKKGEEFSLEAIAPMYENFFRKVTDISIGSGWYEIWDRSLYTQKYLDGQAKKTKNDEMKILYFGDLTAGAMGIIHRDIKKIIDKDYPDINFELMDWAGEKGYQDLFVNKEWKNWDMIIIDPYMSYILDTGWGFTALPKEEQLELKNKFIPVYHHEIDVPADHFNHGWYNDWFTTPVCSINPYIVNQIKDRGIESQLLPIGVSKEKFKPFKQVKQIKKVGFVGNTDKEDWRSIKRPEFFKDICEAAGIEPVIISGREHSWKMYEDIDAIICPSTAEGLPTYFAEAAACKIPFISTEVGIVRYYDKVKTFNTVSEAVDIINYLNESEENIEKYVNEVHDQMFPDRYWENILANHWVPYFKKMINMRKGYYDFIEIGTSDFDTLLEQFPNQRGISIEPIEVYFNALPKPKIGKKLMCAISDFDGTLEMNWVHPNDIKERNLPDWLRGCNSIGPSLKNAAWQQGDDSVVRKASVQAMTWDTLVQLHKIDSVGFIKIDTEGHDHVILSQILNQCNASDFRPSKIQFECNGMGDNKALGLIAKGFIDIGYDYTEGVDPQYNSELNYNKMHKPKNQKTEKLEFPVSAELSRWYSENGDYTHNINCDLTKDSIVFDVGGYSGEWADQIYNKYNCTIYIFEPVKEFYDNIVKRFKGNDKVKVFHIGLGDKTYTTDIKITPDLVGSSIYRETGLTGKVESIEIVDIIEFIKEHKLESIDLLKLNIEGEEFPLLEHLIENNKLNLFNNLKIQFHNFMEFAEERKNNIRTHLQKEFNLVYDFFFVWEGWTIKK